MAGLFDLENVYLKKVQVWQKGVAAPGREPAEWRYDAFLNLIRFSDYGNRASPYGWEIDHIHPRALGGGDELGNLRPLHCRANSSLGGLLGKYF